MIFDVVPVCFFQVCVNGKLYVVIADFEERQYPTGHDSQERSRDNEHHCIRNVICNLLGVVIL